MFSSVDTIWVLWAASMVFFMQAGFTMVEAGFTRAKNAGNIIMKNMMDFSLGSLFFWIVGFGLTHGISVSGIIGMPDFFIAGDYSDTFPSGAFIIFQTVFCATAATIVSGAMAERTKFSAYCLYSVVISALVYPISGHWIWGGGWLAELGFHDFAGSTAVHMVGGAAALVGAKILGPRIGKYSKSGKSKAIPGHSLTLGALGVFILWFGWFGFNGGSTVSMTGDETLITAGNVFVTTNLSTASAAAAAMLITWLRYKKPDVSMTLNGALAGLVGITAGCDAVSPLGAVIIGLISGTIVVYSIEFIDKVLRIDDPVGAIGVHGVCGAVGTIMVGLLSLEEGLLYGHGAGFLGVQVLGVAAVLAWVVVTMILLFTLVNKTIGLRVNKEEEIAGLDIIEHGINSYADFMPMPVPAVTAPASEIKVEDISSGRKQEPSPDSDSGQEKDSSRMTKLSIITQTDRLDALKDALDRIGITGITVSQVLGYGMQKGHPEYYRGVEVESALLPKVRVEIVICKVPVDLAVATIKNALHTGKYGDGKIFIYNVENVIKVRTGEEGYGALQDDE